MSPASGDFNGLSFREAQTKVSIQLMSPASGDVGTTDESVSQILEDCFHSINVPSEWGQASSVTPSQPVTVSIQLMSPASGDSYLMSLSVRLVLVSIQLMSPASGDVILTPVIVWGLSVSIQLMSPASGDLTGINGGDITKIGDMVSIQLMSPASGDCIALPQGFEAQVRFPFN